MSRRRLSKKQLKQDKFVSTTFELAEFLQTHTRNVVIGAFGLLVALGAGLWYRNYIAHAEAAAADLLSAGRNAYEQANYPLAIQDLERLRSEHPRSHRVAEALLMLGDAYFQAGEYDSARGALQAFVDRYGDGSALSYKARRLMGCVLENLREYGAAATSYRLASEDARFDDERIRARIDAARAFALAGQRDRAKEVYRALIESYPNNAEAARAAMLLAELAAGGVADGTLGSGGGTGS